MAEEKKPFIKSVADTVLGSFGGGITGAIVLGVTLAIAGAAVGGIASGGLSAFAAYAAKESVVATLKGAAFWNHVGAMALISGLVSGAAGALAGGPLGAAAGAVTGWFNSRPEFDKEDPLVRAQEKAQEKAEGIIIGALAKGQEMDAARLNKLENGPAEGRSDTHWRQRHPKQASLFVEQGAVVGAAAGAAEATITVPGSPGRQ